MTGGSKPRKVRCDECGTDFIETGNPKWPTRTPKKLLLVEQPRTTQDWNNKLHEYAEWLAGNQYQMSKAGRKRVEEECRKARRLAFIEIGRWAKEEADQGSIKTKELKKHIKVLLGMGDPELDEVMK